MRLCFIVVFLVLAAPPTALAASDAHDHTHDSANDHDHDHHHHHAHVAPRGGTLISLGDHVLHLEILLDTEASTIFLWILDAEAEGAVRTEQEALHLTLNVDDGDPLELTAEATANVLTGETVGDSSEFRVTSPHLVGLDTFSATLDSLGALGVAFRDVFFDYPGETP